MATTTTTSKGIIRTERTARVERECPAGQEYSLRIHRQLITFDGDEEIARKDLMFAFHEPISKVMTMSATRAYLTACQSAKNLTELLGAEVAWYDALVAERRAELKAEAEAAAEEAKAVADAAKAAADSDA